VVAQEPLLRQLVQIAEPRQRAALDALPPETRPAAEAILRQQADAFARDPFAAGTALYADVGKPAPIDDAESRIAQARTIADRRGIPVAPFTREEIAGQRDAVLARYETLPDDMQRALAPLLWPQPPLAVRETASDIAADDPALHADGVEIAHAPPEDAPSAADTQPPLREYRLFAPLPGEEDRPVEAPTEATGTRGSAPATEPDPGSPEYLAADAEARRIVAAQAKEQPTQTKSAGSAFMAPPPVTAPRTAVAAAKAAGGRAVDVARAAGARLAPAAGVTAGTVVGSVAGAIPIILMPTNKQGDYYPIGDDVRLWAPVSQRSVVVERRVDDGWFGTGVGVKWERVPVDAEWASGPDGRRVIAIDLEDLQDELGDATVDAALRADGIIMARPPRRRHRRRRDGRDAPPPTDYVPLHPRDHNGPPGPPPEGPPPPPRPPRHDANDPERRPFQKIPPTNGTVTWRDEADEAERREIRKFAESIGSGHAYDKHVVKEGQYPNIGSKEDFIDFLEGVMLKPSDLKVRKKGRKVYWDEMTETIIIRSPEVKDGGTAFKPKRRRAYFDEQ
jgi:hypothetical protein